MEYKLLFKNLRKQFNLILKDHGLMKYFKNTSWLFGEKILRMSVGLFVGIWVARYLGPDQYGLFSYAQSFVGLFVAFSTLGLDSIVVREIVKNNSKSEDIIGTAFWLKIIGAVSVLLILAVAINFTSNDYSTNYMVFIIASGMIFQSFNVIDFYFQSKVLSKYIVYSNILSLLTSSILKVLCILNDAPLMAFAWIILFDNIILAAGFIYYYIKINKDFKIRKVKFNSDTALKLLNDSWPLILSGIIISIYMKIDQIMIKEMLSSEAVGQYAAAVKLSETWYIIPMITSTSLFPAIINSRKINKELYYKRLQKLYDLLIWLAITITIAMTFLSDWIVTFLYGIEFSQTASVLNIHIWASVFVFGGVAAGKWIVSENLQKYANYFLLIGLFTNLILNYNLIEIYGIYGAAIATLISQAIASLFAPLIFKETRLQFFMLIKSYNLVRILRSI